MKLYVGSRSRRHPSYELAKHQVLLTVSIGSILGTWSDFQLLSINRLPVKLDPFSYLVIFSIDLGFKRILLR